MGLADILFPKRCVGCKKLGSYLCTSCFAKISFSTATLCFVCNRASFDGLTHPVCRTKWTIDGIYSSLVYSGIVKRLLYQFKYQPFLTDLKKPLTDLMYEGLIQQEFVYRILSSQPIIVPIPLEKAKLRKRGYNQAEILARGLGQRGRFDIKSILIRARKTHSQFSLNRDQRKENIKDAFAVGKSFSGLPKDTTIVLIDDLVTSGATLLEAAKTLKKSGIKKVYGLTLAHGQ